MIDEHVMLRVDVARKRSRLLIEVVVDAHDEVEDVLVQVKWLLLEPWRRRNGVGERNVLESWWSHVFGLTGKEDREVSGVVDVACTDTSFKIMTECRSAWAPGQGRWMRHRL